jgi:hypothetical protein
MIRLSYYLISAVYNPGANRKSARLANSAQPDEGERLYISPSRQHYLTTNTADFGLFLTPKMPLNCRR